MVEVFGLAEVSDFEGVGVLLLWALSKVLEKFRASSYMRRYSTYLFFIKDRELVVLIDEDIECLRLSNSLPRHPLASLPVLIILF